MRVSVASYQAVSILHGGPNTQLRKTMQHIGEFGVDMRLFDPWASFRKEDCDVFHIFAANVGTYHLAHEIHVLGVPMVVSPIFFRLQSPAIIKSFFVCNPLRTTSYTINLDGCRIHGGDV